MSFLRAAYRELITSPAQLALCRQTTSVAQLLAQLKQLWKQEFLSDDQLLAELYQCNQQVLDGAIDFLDGQWVPYRYCAKTRSIFWCLHDGHAAEPFHDETISRYRQRIFLNQFITPKTSLASLLSYPIAADLMQPAGFIFHLSRCGSTLVSGCLSELDSTSILSESPLLTEILLDNSLAVYEKQQLLPQLIHLQGSLFFGRDKIIVKWNAWDLFNWSIIRAAFPHVPLVLLIRDPIEILASHQRMPGRHMAGDPSLTGLSPIFTALTGTETLLDIRIRVLHALLSEMVKIAPQPNARLVNYADLNGKKMHELGQHFELLMTAHELIRVEQRMQFYSKDPRQFFRADGAQKRHILNADEREKIAQGLASFYERLFSNNSVKDIIHAE